VLDPELSAALRACRALLLLTSDELRRHHARTRFLNVETLAARMIGLSDAEAADVYQRMLDDADPAPAQVPGTVEIVLAFIERVKAARRTLTAKPS
jgi:hypothetical protein